MRIVVALGGNALLKRGEPMTAGRQRENVRAAAEALAPVAQAHQLVLSHGNGPQVGLLALQAACYTAVEPYPLDVLDAQTEGMIGYLIEQEIGNLLPPDLPLATLLTMIEVDPLDPAFGNPTKFVGPGYSEAEAARIARERGWVFSQDGTTWRRVVPSPLPKRIIEIHPILWLLEHRTIVICAGGGGIPVTSMGLGSGARTGAEAVIDKDYAGALLAKEVGADLFVMATDVAGVYLDWDRPSRRIIRATTPGELRQYWFPEGSMGPKVRAACQFVEETGRRAAIGALGEIQAIVSGNAGTQVSPDRVKEHG